VETVVGAPVDPLSFRETSTSPLARWPEFDLLAGDRDWRKCALKIVKHIVRCAPP